MTARSPLLRGTGRGRRRRWRAAALGTLALMSLPLAAACERRSDLLPVPASTPPASAPAGDRAPTPSALVGRLELARPIPIPGTAAPFAFVDLELDGAADLWVAGASPAAWQLGAPPTCRYGLPELTDAFSFSARDVDADGDVDLVVTRPDSLHLLYAQGAPRPGTRPSYSEELQIADLADPAAHVLDLDGDGARELLITDAVDPPRVVRCSVSGAARRVVPEGLPGLEVERLRLRWILDLDGDGTPELGLSNEAETVAYPLPAGPVDRALVPTLDRILDGAAADLDGDGADDLVIAGTRGGGIWWGRGGGEFDPDPSDAALLRGVRAVGLVDLDLDGRLDLVALGGVQSAVHRNLGRRRFAAGVARLPGASALAWGDGDGDGDPDLVLAPRAGPLLYVENRARRAASGSAAGPPSLRLLPASATGVGTGVGFRAERGGWRVSIRYRGGGMTDSLGRATEGITAVLFGVPGAAGSISVSLHGLWGGSGPAAAAAVDVIQRLEGDLR